MVLAGSARGAGLRLVGGAGVRLVRSAGLRLVVLSEGCWEGAELQR